LGVADVSHHDTDPAGSEHAGREAGICQRLLSCMHSQLRSPAHLTQIPLWDIKSGEIPDLAAEGAPEAQLLAFGDEFNP
jgi:hypothetical protein